MQKLAILFEVYMSYFWANESRFFEQFKIMSKSTEKYLTSLSGEYGVCSELAKRGILASITFGNLKSTDIIINSIQDSKLYSLEVKTSRKAKFVTGFFQKYYSKEIKGPDFWILTNVDKNLRSRYFILSHEEMANVQMQRNGMTAWRKINGVDNVLMNQVLEYEDSWEKITGIVGQY